MRNSSTLKVNKPKPKENDLGIEEHQQKQPKDVDLGELFDEIMINVQTQSVNNVIEQALMKALDVQKAILWINYPQENCFFSASVSQIVPTDKGIVAYCANTKLVQSIENLSKYSAFKETIDDTVIPPDSVVALFPCFNRQQDVVAVVELARPNTSFSEPELHVLTYFQNKMKIYSKFLFEKQATLEAAQSLVSIDTISKTTEKVSQNLAAFFKANSAEFFLLKKKDNLLLHLENDNDNPTIIGKNITGIIDYCLNNNIVVNESVMKNNKHYNPKIDNQGDLACLVVPYKQDENKIWGIVLHGRIHPTTFSKLDENLLLALAPFAVKSLTTSLYPPPDLPQLDDFEKRLGVLLEVAQTLSGVLDIDTLIPTIMERACNLLHAERCSLFLVDKGKQILVSRFHGGLSKALTIPLTRGIIGHTAVTGNVVNIKDAYSDPRFDRSIDQSTGFRTVSLLTVPIYNNRGEITGVTEMINKTDGEAFTEDDIRMLMAFNVFCGTSLDNAKLYKASIDLTRQLRTLTKMSAVLGQTSKLNGVVEEILDNARKIVSASRATLFIYDSNERIIKLFSNIGNDPKYGTLFANVVVQERETKIFDQEDIGKLTKTTTLESAIEKLIQEPIIEKKLSSATASSRSSRTSVVTIPSSELHMPVKESIVDIPLMDSSGTILGIMELECNWKIVSEDMSLLDCFAVFASVAIERSNLKDIAEHGQVEYDLKHWLTEEERYSYSVPQSFVLPQDQLEGLFKIKFDAPKWDGIGHFKVIFNIFNYFGLLQIYKVTNEKFFRFLTEIRDTYKKVPYHNWRHAVDVTQFVTYELITSGYDKILSSFQLFALLVACLCHDANHDGFTNVYNVKAETPLGILFKNQSVMETHHCAVAIDIISRDQSNIFASLNPAEIKKIWTIIIDLILITDMAKHFTFLKEFNELYDRGEWNPQGNPDHLFTAMKMLLKCGDISNVSRPFELANKWCDVLCEEFFRQGDLEAAQGMEYTSDLNDRAHLDKAKSQIGFYTFVCLPLYQATAKAIPKLQCNVDQVMSNLAVWKSEKAKQEEEK